MSRAPTPTISILIAIRAMRGEEALLNFLAGVVLGKNRRAFMPGTPEEVEFYREMLAILLAAVSQLACFAEKRAIDVGSIRPVIDEAAAWADDCVTSRPIEGA